MANKQFIAPIGSTCYAVFNDAGNTPQFWNQSGTPAYEAYNSANWTSSKYCVSATEIGSGLFVAVVPSGITAGEVVAYQQIGSSPATTDIKIASGVAGQTLTAGTGTNQISLTSGQVTVSTNNDKTGYGLSAAAIQSVWDALTSALTTTGSIGKWILDKLDVVVSTRLATSGYTTPPTAVQNRQEMDSNSTKLANLDATVSSRSTFAGGPVASVTGNVGGNVVGSVASVTAPVTVGTNSDKTGYSLASAPPTAASIRSEIDTNSTQLAAIKVKTDNLPSSPAAVGSAMTLAANQDVRNVSGNVSGNVVGSVGSVTGNVGGTVSTVMTLTNLPAAPTDWLTAAAVKADAVTKIQTGLSTYAGTDTAGTATLLTRITGAVPLATDYSTARAAKLDNLDAAISSRSTYAGGAADANAAAIKAKTDLIPASPATEDSVVAVGTTVAALAVVFFGITSLAKWLRAFVRSDAPDATALSEINAGGGTYDVTTDSDQAIADVLAGVATEIEAISPPPGAFTIVLIVTNASNSLAIENARVTYAQAGIAIQTGATDDVGVNTAGLNAGTYIRTVTASGFVSNSATVDVTAGASTAVALTPSAVTSATDPGQTNAYVTCYGADGLPQAGVTVTVVLEKLDYADTGTGRGFSSAETTGISGGDGVALVVIPRGSFLRFKGKRGEGTWYPFPGVDTGSTQMPDMIGQE